MTEIVRADVLRGFPELVRELGGDSDALLRDVGINPAVVSDGDTYISFRSVVEVWERAAATLNCPDFGMRVAQRAAGSLGPISIAVASAENARQAIAIAQRFMHFHNPSAVLTVSREDAANDFVGADLHMPRAPYSPQASERGVVILDRSLRVLCGPSYRPKEVWLKHAPLSPLATYRDVFGETPMFEKSRNGVIVMRALLDAPQPGADAQIHRMAEHYLASIAPPAAENDALAARARTVIAQFMRSGPVTQRDLARALGLHERTLQRRLKAEHTSFEALRDDARRELAQTYLAQPDMPLAHIAEMLGYAEASAFTRAAHRWFGASPREVRKRLTDAR